MERTLLLMLCMAQVAGSVASDCSASRCAEEDEVFLLQTRSEASQRTATRTLSQGLESLGDASEAAIEELNTGEEGEAIYHPMGHPSLLRATFNQKTENVLRTDREVLEMQLDIDQKQEDMKAALTKLKAETYESANKALLREGQIIKKKTQKRRMQLLASLNMQKADNALDEAEKAKNLAFYEKAIHDAESTISSERAKREQIWEKEFNATKAAEGSKNSSAKALMEVWNALSSDRRNISDWEKEDLKNMTAGLESIGMKNFDTALDKPAALTASKDFKANENILEQIMGIAPES